MSSSILTRTVAEEARLCLLPFIRLCIHHVATTENTLLHASTAVAADFLHRIPDSASQDLTLHFQATLELLKELVGSLDARLNPETLLSFIRSASEAAVSERLHDAIAKVLGPDSKSVNHDNSAG